MVWWSFAVVLVEADWLETFRVDVEAELSPECREAIDIEWSLEAFLEGTCFLPGVDDLPGIVPCYCKIAKFNERRAL